MKEIVLKNHKSIMKELGNDILPSRLDAIKIIRSKRKTTSLVIQNNGTALLKAPLFAKDEDILRFVGQHISWLVKNSNKVYEKYLNTQIRFVSGSIIYLLGYRYMLNVIDSNIEENIRVFNEDNNAQERGIAPQTETESAHKIKDNLEKNGQVFNENNQAQERGLLPQAGIQKTIDKLEEKKMALKRPQISIGAEKIFWKAPTIESKIQLYVLGRAKQEKGYVELSKKDYDLDAYMNSPIGEVVILTKDTSEEHIKKIIVREYKKILENFILFGSEKYEDIVGCKANEYSVKKYKSRWGQCVISKKHIQINTYLAMKPYPCLNLTLAHEIAHLVYADHQKEFKELLKSMLEDEKKSKDLLKSHPSPITLDL